MMVLDSMIAAHVAWVPTLDIYEASRDLQRAQTQPWFKDYLHPTLEEYFRPNPANHGSYFIGWTSTDEAFWKDARVVLPRRKETVTMRLDTDLLEWFRGERGYQTRINAILRAYMNAHAGKR